jgi:hypothetical protein
MFVDAALQLSGSITGNTVTGQDVHATDTSVLSTNAIDVASQGVPSGQVADWGEGQSLYGRFETTVAIGTGTSVEMQIIAADAAALTGNVTVIGSTGAILAASLTIGKRFACRINPRLASLGQRYIGARFVSVGTVTAITVTADLGIEVQDGAKFYPSGFAVL